MNQQIKNFIKYITLALIICCQNACNKSLNAEIPSYIEITQFDYYDNNNVLNNNAKITDAWVTMDGQNLGVFEIPSRIPILSNDIETGTHSFDIYPGIKVNGISATRIKYPFYEKFEIDTITERDSTINITPSTRYTKETQLHFNQDQSGFENTNNILEASLLSDTIPILQDETVFQGEKSIGIYLDETHNYFHVTNNEELTLTNNTNTFLELNFKATIGFNVGLIIINNTPNTSNQTQELIQLYATDNWKKIYLDLSPLINMGNELSKYKIYFEGSYDDSEIINGIYIDNLNLVYN